MSDLPETCEVAIIGSGPAGLATAIALKKRGINDVWVIERSAEAGGNPRHCGHSPFGMREFKRVYLGPKYAKKMVKAALKNGVKIALKSTVVLLERGGKLTLSTEDGVKTLDAKRVVLSTGIRENPRSARLISGQRPLGIMTAGALQSMVYLSDNKPFETPVIIGSELVSFSSLATCRHANIKPVAMIEENARSTAWTFLTLYPRLQGVPFLKNTRLVEIIGKKRVEAVKVKTASGQLETIQCDGVIFTGQFTPEASLARLGHLEIDSLSNGPVVDQFGQCSDPSYFASGNILRPVETAGWCWQEGVNTAKHIVNSLNNSINKDINKGNHDLAISINSPVIKFCVPQRLSLTEKVEKIELQIRLTTKAKGVIRLYSNNKKISEKSINGLPERRIIMSLSDEEVALIFSNKGDLALTFQDS